MARILQNISNSDEYRIIKDYMINLKYESVVKSSYAPDRLERWFGYNSNLQSIKDGRHIVKLEAAIPVIFDRIKNTYFNDADSMLMCYGLKPNSDTSIKPHRDHGCFIAKAVMLNFGAAEYIEYNYDGTIINYDLNDGDVVEIDTKIIHASRQYSELRMNATLRKLKPEFIPRIPKPIIGLPF